MCVSLILWFSASKQLLQFMSAQTHIKQHQNHIKQRHSQNCLFPQSLLLLVQVFFLVLLLLCTEPNVKHKIPVRPGFLQKNSQSECKKSLIKSSNSNSNIKINIFSNCYSTNLINQFLLALNRTSESWNRFCERPQNTVGLFRGPHSERFVSLYVLRFVSGVQWVQLFHFQFYSIHLDMPVLLAGLSMAADCGVTHRIYNAWIRFKSIFLVDDVVAFFLWSS